MVEGALAQERESCPLSPSLPLSQPNCRDTRYPASLFPLSSPLSFSPIEGCQEFCDHLPPCCVGIFVFRCYWSNLWLGDCGIRLLSCCRSVSHQAGLLVTCWVTRCDPMRKRGCNPTWIHLGYQFTEIWHRLLAVPYSVKRVSMAHCPHVVLHVVDPNGGFVEEQTAGSGLQC